MTDVRKIQDIAPEKTDRRRLKTRTAIIGAGQKLFASKPIDGVTIDDIVEAADVAKGSFYNHFDGKESLADAIVDLVQGDCEREVYAANQDINDAATRVARAVATLVRYSRLHPDRYRAMVNLNRRRTDMDAPINAGLRRDIERGIETHQFKDISVAAGMLAVFGMIATSVDQSALYEADETVPALAGDMAFMLLRALGVESAKAKPIVTDTVKAIFNRPWLDPNRSE